MKSVLTKVSAIKRNPNNPRIVNDDKFKKLVKSIQDFPKMLEIRPIVVNDDMIVLGGNMRLKACKEAGLSEVPVIKVDDLTEEQQREFIIKDNVGFGEWDWDLLANEWDTDLLDEWGLEVEEKQILEDEEDDEEPDIEFTEELNETHNYMVLYFDNEIDWLNITSLFGLKTVKALDSKKGFEKKGVGRVIKGSDFLSKLDLMK